MQQNFLKTTCDINVHSDESCLSVRNSHIRAVGHFWLGDNKHVTEVDKFQGLVHQECSEIKPLVEFAAECEIVTLFLNY